MKKTFSFLFTLALLLPFVQAQSFKDDFESYAVKDYLGDVSPDWTTWSGSTGGSEDIQVVDNESYSGTQSIFYDSPNGGGPQDIVLPFGGVHNTGKFVFKSMWKIPYGNAAYFNFQGGATIGSSWAMDFYMDNNGYFYVNKLSGVYPQDQWFEIKVVVDFASNRWEVFIDNVSQGTFSSSVNSVSFLDIYGVYNNSSFWVDDVSYCFDNACNPDLEITSFSINPSPICSNHKGDVNLEIYNYGPDYANGFALGLDMVGQSRIGYQVKLNNLAPGTDTTITIPGLFKTNLIGTGRTIKAINVSHDRNIMNDTIATSITVNPSPSGASVIAGSPFQGRLDIGSESQPDLIEVGKTNKYQILPPAGYTNSGYSSSWALTSIVGRTSYGTLVPSGAYTITYPSSGNNGTLSFTGSSAFLDSNITFSFTMATTPNGCDSVVKRTLRVVPTPKPDFRFPASVCLGDFTEFENKSTIHSGFITSKWYFGDNDSSDNTNPIHEYRTAGIYNVRLVTTSSPYGIIRDTTIVLMVGEIPTVKFKVINKCEGVALDFQNQTTIGNGVLSYDWDFGDASVHSTNANPAHMYAAQGAYRVRLTASANGCVSSLTKNAYTFARPVASFTVPSSPVCSRTTVNMPNTSTLAFGVNGANWTFGDGGISTQTDARHTYATSGTYTVKLLSVSEFGCMDSVTHTVVIKPSPELSVTPDKLCFNSPTVFNNNSKDFPGITATYNWLFNDGTTYTTKDVTKTWDILGPKTVKLVSLLSNGCSDELLLDYNIQNQPKADFTFKDICSGSTVNFVNKSSVSQGNVNYEWNFGDGPAKSNLYNPDHVYAVTTTTTFTVSLVTSLKDGCADTMNKVLTVTEIPKCDFSFSGVYLPGNLGYKFIPANTGYAKYEWYFGDGGSASTASPIYQYLYTGPFKVKLIATNSAGCSCEKTLGLNAAVSGLNSISSGNINIYPNPAAQQVSIDVTDNLLGAEYVIYNSMGQEVLKGIVNTASTIVNTGNFSNGFYTVKIVSGTTNESYKLIVNH